MKKQPILEAVDPALVLGDAGISFQETGKYLVFRCPFHSPDNNPSCLFNTETKYYECKSCGQSGDAIDFLARVAKVERLIAAKLLADRFNVQVGLVISPLKIEQWKKNLKNSDRAKLIFRSKGITEESMEKYDLGEEKAKLVIPFRSPTGEYIGATFYMPGSKPKYKRLPGLAKIALYPLGFPDAVQEDQERVFLTEGELKAILLRQLGYYAFSPVGGCNAWDDSWGEYFKGKDVYIVYDIDIAGKKSSLLRAKDLFALARSVRIVRLPLQPKKYPGGDVTDYFVSAKKSKEEFELLLERTVPWFPSHVAVGLTGKTNKDPDKVKLSDVTNTKHFTRLLETTALVAAKDTAPYIVPRGVKVLCDQDQKACAMCPIYDTNGEVEVSSDNPVLLEFVGSANKHLDHLYYKACGVPKACKACAFQTTSTYSVEELQLIPQINLTTSEDHCTVRAFSVSSKRAGIETNAAYKFEGRVYPFPRTQQAVFLTNKQEPCRDNLAEYEIQDKTKLFVFQPRDWTVPAIRKKFEELYRDFAHNVTGIYERERLHILFDLIYHSPLWIRLDDQLVKGWAEGVIIGDSGQGKSTIGEKLLRFYELGERINCKNATVAGLLGGLAESSRRWFLMWGIIPLNDRRIVILDEVKGTSVEVLGALTDMRSSGIAEIVKIERRRANARTRLVWISNPRSSRQIDTYNYGIEAIRELFGSLEDVRRIDIAAAVGSGQVRSSTINIPRSRRKKVPHKYKAKFCKQLVLWAWSRQPEEIIFPEETLARLYEVSEQLSSKYHSGIPLVEPADQKNKVARLAAAAAARTFSYREPNEILVRPCHVEFVSWFMQDCYDDMLMGYDRYSNDRKESENLQDTNEVQNALNCAPYVGDLVANMLSHNVMTLVDIQNWGGLDRDQAGTLLSVLVRKNAVKHIRSYYVKTPQFTQWLRANSEKMKQLASMRPDI